MHRLDDNTLITKTLIRRFHAEGEFEGAAGQFFAFVQRSNGDMLVHSVGPDVGPAERMFAIDLLTYLNKQLHHDGAWVMVFTHPRVTPPETDVSWDRLVILWMDKDGDVQFPLEHEQGIVVALEWGLLNWAAQCESAWGLWHQAMRSVLDPQPNETFMRAKGEKRPTVH